MKKRRITKLLLLLMVVLLVLSLNSLLACTSFAVYSERPLYGMNFDYDLSPELKFCVSTTGDLRVFYMKLQWERDFFTPIVAMNTDGLFCNLQMLFPEVPAEISVEPGEIFLTELLKRSSATLKSCSSVIDITSNHKIVMDTVSLHSLYADVHGDALVVEVGQKDNLITRIDGDFIVMTNFPIYEFTNVSYENVYGGGSDRYKTAYRYLMEHARTFGLEDGFALLRSVANQGPYSATRCSMVFDPERSLVYISLEAKYDKIWKLSLENSTVESFRGFDQHISIDIGEGVLASELKALESKTAPGPEIKFTPTIPLEYVVLGLILISVVLFLGYKRRR